MKAKIICLEPQLNPNASKEKHALDIFDQIDDFYQVVGYLPMGCQECGDSCPNIYICIRNDQLKRLCFGCKNSTRIIQ